MELSINIEPSTLLDVIGDTIKERESTLLKVVGDAVRQQISKGVDLNPVIDAVDRMTAAMNEQTQMFTKLMQVLSSRPQPVIKLPERNGRRIRVKHDDGSESIITEE